MEMQRTMSESFGIAITQGRWLHVAAKIISPVHLESSQNCASRDVLKEGDKFLDMSLLEKV